MEAQISRLMMIWCVAILALCVGVSAYREYLHADASEVTKVACADRSVFSGEYSRCLRLHSPASRGSS
jgi:hypothetical protein